MESNEKRISELEANVSAPIYPLYKKDLTGWQQLLKKHSGNINIHPIIVLRPEEKLNLPDFKMNAGSESITVRKMTCYGELGKKVCTGLRESSKQTVKFRDYKEKAESDGVCTKEDLVSTLCGKSFTFEYGDHNEKPEKFVDMEKSSLKWKWAEESGLVDLGCLPGVNTEFIYFGSKGSFFAWHQEEGDLLSANILIAGEPKLWLAVHKRDYPKLVELFRETKEYKDCKVFWRHKSHILNLKKLRELNVTIYEHLQMPGDIVITNGFHQGGNTGFNVALAINVAIEGEDWTYSCIRESEKTSCDSKCKYKEKTVVLPDLKPDYIVCDECPKLYKFYCDEAKRNHDMDKHKCWKNMNCRYCNKSCAFVLRHEKKFHKSELKETRCKLCLKLFENTWKMRKHLTTHKRDQKGYKKCLICEKKLRLTKDIDNHVCIAKK